MKSLSAGVCVEKITDNCLTLELLGIVDKNWTKQKTNQKTLKKKTIQDEMAIWSFKSFNTFVRIQKAVCIHRLIHISRALYILRPWESPKSSSQDDLEILFMVSQFSRSVMSDSLRPHELQHAMLSDPSPTPEACSNSYPSSWWCHPTIPSSVILFSSCLQSFPAPESFPGSQFFPLGGQGIGISASASVLPMNIQDWFPLGWTGWISL